MKKEDSKNQFLPNEILEELDIKKQEDNDSFFKSRVRPIIETHQVKLSVPAKIVKEIDFKMEKIGEQLKPKKIKIELNIKNRQIIFKY